MRLNRGSVNRWVSRAAVSAALALAGVGWAGCGQVKANELVAGDISQVAVPSYLQSVVITLYFDDTELVFEGNYPVYDSGQPGAYVRLPRTLGVVKGPTQGVVRITVAGFTQSIDDPTVGAFNGFDPEVGTTTAPVAKGGGAQILRRSTQPYSEGQILYVPLPLHYSCYSVDCDALGTNCNPNPATADSEPARARGASAFPRTPIPRPCPPTTIPSPTARPTPASARSPTEHRHAAAAGLHGLRDRAAAGRQPGRLHLRHPDDGLERVQDPGAGRT